MKKILILTYYWPPSGGPGVQRWLKFSNYLPDMGYAPLVIAPSPHKANYPVSDASLLDEVHPEVKVFHTSTMEPFALYKLVTRRKKTPYSGFANEIGREGISGTISRFIRGNLFVPDARVGWNRFAVAKARELIREHNIDTIITTSPPHSTQLAGLQLKKEFPHLKWIADLRDPWTDIFYYHKMLHLPFSKARDKKLEKRVLDRADVVVTVSDYVKNLFALKIANPEKIRVITNGYDERDFDTNKEYDTNKYFTIAYVGTISDEYDLFGFIRAIRQLLDEIGNNIQVEFTGSVCLRWLLELEKHFGNTFFSQGHTSHQKALERMQKADLLLLVIPTIEQNQGIVTGKIFEYLAAGKPILGIGPVEGDAAKILKQTRAGQLFDYNNTEGIHDFVIKTMQNKGLHQPDVDAIGQYSRKKLTEKLTQLFML